jgi:hypothetical protein
MTDKEIIRMAREAGIPDPWIKSEQVKRFADLVLKAERQACAELVQVHMTAASIDMGVAMCVRGRK